MQEKLQVQFLVEKNGKNYVFLMPGDGNLGEAYSAAWEMLNKLSEKIVEANKKAAPQESPKEEQPKN